MESLYLLLPLSVLLVLALIGLFGWALNADQFDDLEREGWRVLEEDRSLSLNGERTALDLGQGPSDAQPGESRP